MEVIMVQVFSMRFILSMSMLLISVTVSAYNVSNEKWPGQQADLTVNINGNSSSGTSWNQGINQAVSAWNSGMNGFDIVPESKNGHPCAGYIDAIPEDFQNAVGFYSNDCGILFGSGVLAITNTIYSGNEIVEADIVFNVNEPWDIYSGPDKVQVTDFRRVAVHELGHFVGLGHETVAHAIMAPFIGNIEIPTADDLAGANFLYPGTIVPDPSALIVNLEEPSAGGIGSGISNIRGWAVANTGIDRVEIYLDGLFLADIPFGGTRSDVGRAFPEYLDSDNAGFSMAFAWGNISAGLHTLTARAFDNNGNFEDSTNSFTVTSFDNPFIKPPASVAIQGGATISDGNTVTLNQVVADQKTYQVKLKWNTATQQFNIIQITPQ